jgi:diguanylate cyclase (GGDEF)-like protein/PAS domain S-box-containing protein
MVHGGRAAVVGVAWTPPAVLLVNDVESQRVALGSMLASLGVVVVEADSGPAALSAVSRRRFALILMDVRMPGMNGYETAALIGQRRESSLTPIIFVTAFGREDTETIAAYGNGAVDFIFTPVVPEVLRAKVSVFVDLFVQAAELQRSLDSITALNAALRDCATNTQAVLDGVVDGIVTIGDEGLIEALNPSARALFGYREDDVIGQPLTLLIAPERRDEFGDSLPARWAEPIGANTENVAVETIGYRRDGSRFAMEMQRGTMKLGARSVTLVFVRDISERRAYTESLEHRALHDALTGLANRTLFEGQLEQALALAHRAEETRAVLIMDLDGFKQVNDTLGHDHGDRLLQQVAARLVAVLREPDMIARLGGDEFAILPGDAAGLAAAAAVALKIQQTCQPAFVVDGQSVRVSASIGIALFPEHGTTTGELLRRADAAMYLAKRSGRGHAVFDVEHETHSARQLALLTDLRQCITRDQLVVHYQPKIDLGTREISGVEALLRWQHPDRGLLLPASFMPEIKRTELIEPVTRWLLGQALGQQHTWLQQGIDLTMAINISAASLSSGSSLPDTVAELTETWGTAAGRLTLELTEDALIDPAAPALLQRLHTMGEQLSIDDYGTGHSSLAHLQRLPLDEIKIDKSFITHLTSNSDDEVIVRSTIDLAHNLGLNVVAEGVENQTAMDQLLEYKCDSVQGYLFRRPCPAEQLTTWLTESPYTTPISADD